MKIQIWCGAKMATGLYKRWVVQYLIFKYSVDE